MNKLNYIYNNPDFGKIISNFFNKVSVNISNFISKINKAYITHSFKNKFTIEEININVDTKINNNFQILLNNKKFNNIKINEKIRKIDITINPNNLERANKNIQALLYEILYQSFLHNSYISNSSSIFVGNLINSIYNLNYSSKYNLCSYSMAYPLKEVSKNYIDSNEIIQIFCHLLIYTDKRNINSIYKNFKLYTKTGNNKSVYTRNIKYISNKKYNLNENPEFATYKVLYSFLNQEFDSLIETYNEFQTIIKDKLNYFFKSHNTNTITEFLEFSKSQIEKQIYRMESYIKENK